MPLKTTRTFALAVATVLGVGYSPIGPGSCGTLVGIFIFWGLSGLPLWLYGVTLCGVIAVGTWAAAITGSIYGEVDNQRIVIDEVAGYLVTMISFSATPINLIVGFFLFRLFDILKPFPAGWVDRNVKSAFGVMLDDILAGVYGFAVLAVLHMLAPSWFMDNPL